MCGSLDTGSREATIPFVLAAATRIVLDPAILHGKPVIRGTRVPVTVVAGNHAGGIFSPAAPLARHALPSRRQSPALGGTRSSATWS